MGTYTSSNLPFLALTCLLILILFVLDTLALRSQGMVCVTPAVLSFPFSVRTLLPLFPLMNLRADHPSHLLLLIKFNPNLHNFSLPLLPKYSHRRPITPSSSPIKSQEFRIPITLRDPIFTFSRLTGTEKGFGAHAVTTAAGRRASLQPRKHWTPPITPALRMTRTTITQCT